MRTMLTVSGAGALGLGLLLIGCGLTRRPVLAPVRRPRAADDRSLSALLAAAAGAVVLAATGWPVAGLTAGAAALWLPGAARSGGRHQRELELVEGIASWAEQLRDTLTAANGLEHAIGATAPLAPAVLRRPVRELAARAEYGRLDDALREFADEVDHPLADFVVAALVTASEHEARDLGTLLGHLAVCARDEATMRSRVWVSRARTRSSVRIIVGVVLAFVAGLLVLDRQYLAPYSTASGQLVLGVVIVTFAASFVAMDRMGQVTLPDRFVGRGRRTTP